MCRYSICPVSVEDGRGVHICIISILSQSGVNVRRLVGQVAIWGIVTKAVDPNSKQLLIVESIGDAAARIAQSCTDRQGVLQGQMRALLAHSGDTFLGRRRCKQQRLHTARTDGTS